MILLSCFLQIFTGLFLLACLFLSGFSWINLSFFLAGLTFLAAGTRLLRLGQPNWHICVTLNRALVILSAGLGFFALHQFVHLEKQAAVGMDVTGGKFQSERGVLIAFFVLVISGAMLAFLSRCRVLESIWKRPYDSISREVRRRAGSWKIWTLAAVVLWSLTGLWHMGTWHFFQKRIALHGSSIGFSPDGSKLIAHLIRKETGRIRSTIWDLKTGELQAQVQEEERISPDGRILARVSPAGNLTLQVLDSGQVFESIANLPEAHSLQFSPDSKTLAFSDPKGLLLWDIPSKKERLILPNLEPVRYSEFSPDGRRLALATASRGQWHIDLWDLSDKTKILFFEFPYDGGHSPFIKFSPDGGYLVILKKEDSQDVIEVWDLDLKIKRLAFSQPRNVFGESSFVFSSDGKLVAMAAGGGENSAASKQNAGVHEADIWVTGKGKRSHRIRLPANPEKIQFSKDHRMLAILAGGKISVFYLFKYKLQELPVKESVREFEFTPQGSALLMLEDHQVVLWDVNLNQEIWSQSPGQNLEHMMLSPNGDYLALWFAEDRLELWNMTEKKRKSVWKGLDGLFSVAFSPDSREMAFGSYAALQILDLSGSGLKWKFKIS